LHDFLGEGMTENNAAELAEYTGCIVTELAFHSEAHGMKKLGLLLRVAAAEAFLTSHLIAEQESSALAEGLK